MKIFHRRNIWHTFSSNSVGWSLFQLGIFLLPSSALLAAIALLIATIIATFHRSDSIWDDKWNYLLIFVAAWMIVGSFQAYSGWLAWIGLANWIPLFWCFWGFQPFLRTAENRQRVANCLIAGTVPVLVTGFGQLWLGWEGPWQILNGLIIWFVAPGGQPPGRLSGLFDYANIAAAWLVVVWPFSLAFLIQPFSNYKKRSVAFLFAVSIITALILTDSRNGWGGLVAAIPFVLGSASWFWLVPCLLMLLLPIALAVLPGIDFGLQQFARHIVPETLWSRLNDMRFVSSRPLAATRISQWEVALNLIKDKPWMGWGAAAFSVLYPILTGLWHGHSHNLPLELAVSHGVPVAISIVVIALALLIIALARGVLGIGSNQLKISKLSIFDRAWWTSTFLLVCLHGTDIPSFDSRINIVGWILLSGLRCLIDTSSLRKQSLIE